MSSSTLAAGVRQLRGSLALQGHKEDSDEQLLHAFTARRDDSAFAALVRRHGSMVLGVCRRVLGHQQDAEDAFQATFLVLARNAAALRNKTALASWLHGIAYRTALKAKRSAARRRKHEGRTPSRSPADPVGELLWREVRTLLDEEIARLPNIYQSVFILCCLEGLSQAEVGQRLGLKERTVLSRLTEARKRLQQRLAQRGVELTTVLAASALAAPSASALPAVPFLRSSGAVVSPAVAALANSAPPILKIGKAKLAAVLLAVSMLTGTGLWVCRDLNARAVAPPQSTAREAAEKPKPRTSRKERRQIVEVSGQVLDPDGKPVRDARLYLPSLRGKQLQSQATSDAEGRFRFEVTPTKLQLSYDPQQPWSSVSVVAVAEGYGPGVAGVGTPEKANKLAIRLAKDDIILRGRILDLQGKPVAGATVRVDGLGVTGQGGLRAFLDDLKGRTDGYAAESKFLTTVRHADFIRLYPPATTGSDGRFQIKGIGRERIAHLMISGPTIATQQVRAYTQPGEKMQRLKWASSPRGGTVIYYGADFEHVAPPTKPIIGLVRDKDTGKPLAGVTMQSEKLAGDTLYGLDFIRTVTDKDGRYRLIGMPKGEDNLIRAVGPEGSAYMGVVRSVENTAGVGPVTVDFELRRGVLVKGRVTDKKTGAAVSAHIEYFTFKDNPHRKEFEDAAFERYRQTEADGSFEMVVLPGRGILAARAHDGRYLVGVGAEKMGRRDRSGFLAALTPLCIPPAYHRLAEINPAQGAETLTCDLACDPGRTLQGRVVGPDGQPLAGARICGLRSYTYTYWDHEPFQTAEFTAYGLTPDRPRNLLVIHEGKKLAGSLLVRGDEKGPLTIKLQPWGVVTGRLVTAEGQPYTKGEMCFLRPIPYDLTVGSHPLQDFPRDKNGRFRIEGFVPGLKYNLAVVEASTVKGYIFQDFTIESGQTKDLGDTRINLTR